MQINRIPDRIKETLATGSRQKVSELLNAMKNQGYLVDNTKQIWCFPDNRPDFTFDETGFGQTISEFDKVFPDPLLFCVGVYAPEMSHQNNE